MGFNILGDMNANNYEIGEFLTELFKQKDDAVLRTTV